MAPSRSRDAAAAQMRSPLGRARGLGSAKEGVDHWLLQRVTAVALVPLSLWFVIALIELVGADFDAMQDWVGRPLPAILLVLLLIATFYHAALGLQVVIEDYVHGELARVGLVILTRLACAGLAVAGIVAVLTLALGAAD
ncbi:MAG TPA: succinate dehydrogenase, hydrophobic membrane anchor protein [Stellaceae bacterium]|jgi:succinate dehydrogenase / fumarate reductase membrane anchor subunit|nr:succinate dehydrogenase, hydrophobic membrane anchor protein [Stellaceae bacterium]